MKIIRTPETIEELQAIWNTTDKVKQELPAKQPVSRFGEVLIFNCFLVALLIFACLLFRFLR